MTWPGDDGTVEWQGSNPCDGGGKGYLTRHELRCAHISLLGHPPSLIEVDSLAPKAHGTGVELATLHELMARKLALQEPDEVVRRAFRAFDVQAKGYVSRADLEAAIERVAPQLPRHTVELIFSQLDGDRDGRVSYRDFNTMFAVWPPPPRVHSLTDARGVATA